MAADVAESAQHALLVPRDDDGFAGEIRREKTLWIADRALRAVDFAAVLVERADKLPRAAENSLLFEFEN